MASFHDEVVPFYSATLHSYHHPLIRRAMFIHEQDYKQDFITQLVRYSLLLRNRGISDHGLSVHLSPLLAGHNFTTGKMSLRHSILYEDEATYHYALNFAMQDIVDLDAMPPLIVKPFNANKLYEQNQHELEFILGRLVSAGASDPSHREDNVLQAELKRLLELFDEWRPTSYNNKDIKLRLSGLNSETLRHRVASKHN